MRARVRSWVATAVAAATLLAASVASADPRTAYLVDQLKTNDDYRVRTQAALALGASADDAAVSPLCDALDKESNVTVRTAAAAALGKLGKQGGLPCLKSAGGRESAPSVKSQIQKSISSLEGGGSSGSSGTAAIAADTKFYVAIQVTNKTSRPAAEVDSLVRGAMQRKIASKSGYAVAPPSETTAVGGNLVKSKNLKGFFLIATVEAPVYDGGNLTQVVRVSMWTYPGKALQGEFSPKLTQTGTSKGDTQSENLLMKMCVENAIETFQKVAASL